MSIGFLDTPIGTLRITAEKGKITEITLLRRGAQWGQEAQGTQEFQDPQGAQGTQESQEPQGAQGTQESQEPQGAQSEYFDNPKDLYQIQQTKLQLTEYFAGKRRSFQLDIELHGTTFQKKVWQALLSVPFGETLSYGQVAEKAGHPKAQRAAGSAIGKNPLLIVVPCHRIIRSDGGLGGFAAGIENKKILQKIEEIGRNEKRGF